MNKQEIYQKIILALDMPDLKRAEFVLDELSGYLKMVKMGSSTFYKHGEALLKMVQKRGLEIFLDFKFHDIPNTVASAISSVVPWGVRMLTVHLAGGRQMLEAALKSASEISSQLKMAKPYIVGISVLTSLDEAVLRNELKINLSLKEFVSQLVVLAKESGLDGVVASPQEIDLIRALAGKDFKIVCPGIRMEENAKADQKRTLTPREALLKGADYLVMGRPLYEAERPREVYEKMIKSMKGEK
ncbi:MAG: orotidine-5'-phosphate decarboxylase [Chlamydiae bacterium]|nr:orotidine-5'-phosphate decarboxylase [Chlamydiota bacterium]MBI3266107.1 orotidine-5'-phosphate decarboxylase [Chlamydiota bacterium]